MPKRFTSKIPKGGREIYIEDPEREQRDLHRKSRMREQRDLHRKSRKGTERFTSKTPKGNREIYIEMASRRRAPRIPHALRKVKHRKVAEKQHEPKPLKGNQKKKKYKTEISRKGTEEAAGSVNTWGHTYYGSSRALQPHHPQLIQ